METLHSLPALIAGSAWRLRASLGSKVLLLSSGRATRKRAKQPVKPSATKALPRKASALMSPKRRITNKLTITSPKSTRSEERRVGKECRYRGSPYQKKKDRQK